MPTGAGHTPGAAWSGMGAATARNWPVWIGVALLSAPVLVDVATTSWATEQGSYGLILLVLAVWLLARRWPAMVAARAPGATLAGGSALAAALIVYVGGRVVRSVPVETYALYAVIVAALYLAVGWRGLRPAGFALGYMLLALPLPERVLATIMPALRYGVTTAAVELLGASGMAVGQSGMTLSVDQYRIAIVDACSGMNSLISLSAIGLFYLHARGRHVAPGIWAAFALVIVGFAIFANFVRVVALVLLTHVFGSATAQGPLHDLLGFITFAVALGGVIAVDGVLPARRR